MSSQWSIDHDDASSFYTDSENVCAYGMHKWRDGVLKNVSSNIYVIPEDASPGGGGSQQKGVGFYAGNTNRSVFEGNEMYNWGDAFQFFYTWSVPSPANEFVVDNNRYYNMRGNESEHLNFYYDGVISGMTFEDWQKDCECDANSKFNDGDVTLDDIIKAARVRLQLL